MSSWSGCRRNGSSSANSFGGRRSSCKRGADGTGLALDDVRSVQRKGGTAVLITYDADSAVNPVTGKAVRASVERYTFWQGGRQAVLTLAGPTGADNVDPWRIVSDSLRWRA